MTSLRHTTLFIALIFSQFSLAEPENVAEETCEDVHIPKETNIESVKSLGSFVPAKAVKRVHSKYPDSEAKAGNEGWVQISYVIDTEGNVVDPVVEDSVGGRAFRRNALRAVKNWKFKPAMKDGKPTQMCHQSVQFDFAIEGKQGASRKFVRKYKELYELINNDQYEDAEKLLADLKAKNNTNRYENAFLSDTEAKLARKRNDPVREVKSLRKTLFTANTHKKDKKTFNDDYTALIHQRLFVLSVNAGSYADALDYANKLKKLNQGETYYAKIADSVEKVESIIKSDESIFVPFTIGESGTKFHRLVRNKFAFTSIEGVLESVEVRCESHREAFTVAEDSIWNIPASWGQCQVMVRGKSGASFNLVEVNKA